MARNTKVPSKPASFCSANCACTQKTAIPAVFLSAFENSCRMSDHARTEENAGRRTEAESEPGLFSPNWSGSSAHFIGLSGLYVCCCMKQSGREVVQQGRRIRRLALDASTIRTIPAGRGNSAQTGRRANCSIERSWRRTARAESALRSSPITSIPAAWTERGGTIIRKHPGCSLVVPWRERVY